MHKVHRTIYSMYLIAAYRLPLFLCKNAPFNIRKSGIATDRSLRHFIIYLFNISYASNPKES